MATDPGWAVMASSHVTESWGQAMGITTIAHYNSVTGAKYLGWSYDYAHAEIADVHKQPVPPTPGPIPQTSTAIDGLVPTVPHQITAPRFFLAGSPVPFTTCANNSSPSSMVDTQAPSME